MPAAAGLRPRERAVALAAVTVVQIGLGLALLSGFRVEIGHARDVVERLVDFRLAPPPPPPPTPPPKPKPRPKAQKQAAAPAPHAAAPGGTPGPAPHGRVVASKIALAPTPAPLAGGGRGTGASQGSGSGGGGGSGGTGEDEGETDLVQIAGAITPADYPRHLREAGVGGRVEFTFTVEPNGRVGRCTVTRSSGVPELDGLTCRLVQQRFVYRPSTDRYGRPIADEVDGEHDWVAR